MSNQAVLFEMEGTHQAISLPKLANVCRIHCRCGQDFQGSTPDLAASAYRAHLTPAA